MKKILVKEIMNPEVMTVRDNMSIQDLANFLTEMEISGAPVVDEEGRLMGVVSMTDIVHRTTEGVEVPGEESSLSFYHGWEKKLSEEEIRQLHTQDEGNLVSDIMTPTVYSVTEDTNIPEIAETMINSRIHRVLVMREDQVVGIITSLDMLKLLCE
jgi:predicted transcriptional regulator